MATTPDTTNSAKSTNTSQSTNTNQSANTNQSGNTKQSNNQSNNQSGNKSNTSSRRKSSRRKSSGSKSSGNAFGGIHKNVTGTSNYFSSASPNLIFLVGGSLILASQWTNFKKVFRYAWNNNNVLGISPDNKTATNALDFWDSIKTPLVLILFIFILTITARVMPFLGGIWLVTLGGLWILWLMRNPQILQLLQSAGEEHLNSGPK